MKYVSSVSLLALLSVVGCSGGPEDVSTVGSAQLSGHGNGNNNNNNNNNGETVVVDWNETAITAIRASSAAPTVAARALAEMHTAAYDAWSAYSDDATPTQSVVTRQPKNQRTNANKRVAISYAAYRVLTDLFPAQEATFRKRLNQFGGDPSMTSTTQTSPVGVGNAAAAATIAFRHEDASNQLGDVTPGPYSDYTGYAPVNTPTHVNDPNRWQPLHVGGVDQTFTTPQWQNVLAFALTDSSAFRPAQPPQFGSAAYQKQAADLLDLSAHLDDRRKVIAEYWADGPGTEQSPGHWMRFAQFVSARDNHSIDDDAKLFFALGNAMLDTSIAVWESKRFYDAERPITAIRTLFAGKNVQAWAGPGLGTRTIDGSTWLPYDRTDEVTPPSPEYAAEESAFAFAAAGVLERFTGSDAFGADHLTSKKSSGIEPGRTPHRDVRLCWRTFDDAAHQAGRAQQFRGAHFAGSDQAGRALGKAIAAETWKAALVLFKEAHAGCKHVNAHRADCDDDRDDRF
jgi:hypothetical protein